MTANPAKAPKKEKEKKQTPQERLEAMRYNHMMYGPTDGEMKAKPKKIDYGAPYLKHPKFQSLITAFKRGAEFKFDITAEGRLITIATDGSHITFDNKVLYYSRIFNKHEDNLFLDRAAAVQVQTNEAAVHLVFAVLRSFPELAEQQLLYMHHKFYHGNDSLEFGASEPGTNLALGPFKSQRPSERAKS
jgi:hypothetical protein